MAAVWTSISGVLIVCWTLREVFTDLFRPSASGSLSSFVGKRLFSLGKHAHWMLRSAGPLSVVVVITLWALLISLGFALIYWGYYPAGFVHTMTENTDVVGRVWSAFYFSLACLTTLGSTEFSPREDWIRIVGTVESLIGISLITASVTWIVLIYPALGRTRALARRAFIVAAAQEQTGLNLLSADVASLLGEIAAEVVRARVDFVHFPLIYYFQVEAESASLGKSLLLLAGFADQISPQEGPEPARFSAALLRIALHDLAQILRRRFVPSAPEDDPREIFKAVGRDHLEDEGEG